MKYYSMNLLIALLLIACNHAHSAEIPQRYTYEGVANFDFDYQSYSIEGSNIEFNLEDCSTDLINCKFIRGTGTSLISEKCDATGAIDLSTQELKVFRLPEISFDHHGNEIIVTPYSAEFFIRGEFIYNLSFYNPDYGIVGKSSLLSDRALKPDELNLTKINIRPLQSKIGPFSCQND